MLKRSQNGRYLKKYNFNDNQLAELYKKLGTLKNVAKELNVSPEFIRKEFLNRNLEYTKKVQYICDDYFFDNESEETYYWAGMMAADGNVSKEDDISLSLAKKDIGHIEKFKAALKSNSPISIKHNEKSIIIGHEVGPTVSARFRIRSHIMANSLRDNFNIVPAKTKIYSIPNNILKSEFAKDFIRGYFDGDGWFSKTGKRLSLGFCGNLNTMQSIRNLLASKSLGIGSLYKQKNIYKLTYAKQHDVMLISDYMYRNSTCYLDRKFNIAKTTKEYDDNTMILNLKKDEIINALNKYKTVVKAAKELNCSKNGLRNYMKKFRVGIYA